MFILGDAVVHPDFGAGFITGQAKMKLLDKNLEYFEIEIFGLIETKILIPVENAASIGLRYAISDDELDALWQILSSNAEELPDDNKERKEVLKQRFETHEICKIAELIRDMEWRKEQGKRINMNGKKMYDKAMDFMVREIAVSQGGQMQSARSKVKEALAHRVPSVVN